jgi:hypothetical protein
MKVFQFLKMKSVFLKLSARLHRSSQFIVRKAIGDGWKGNENMLFTFSAMFFSPQLLIIRHAIMMSQLLVFSIMLLDLWRFCLSPKLVEKVDACFAIRVCQVKQVKFH